MVVKILRSLVQPVVYGILYHAVDSRLRHKEMTTGHVLEIDGSFRRILYLRSSPQFYVLRYC